MQKWKQIIFNYKQITRDLSTGITNWSCLLIKQFKQKNGIEGTKSWKLHSTTATCKTFEFYQIEQLDVTLGIIFKCFKLKSFLISQWIRVSNFQHRTEQRTEQLANYSWWGISGIGSYIKLCQVLHANQTSI